MSCPSKQYNEPFNVLRLLSPFDNKIIMSIPVFIDLPINEQVNYAAINGEMLRESILLLYARMESQYVNKVHKNLIIWYRIVVPER